jgi:hypothetical protein
MDFDKLTCFVFIFYGDKINTRRVSLANFVYNNILSFTSSLD